MAKKKPAKKVVKKTAPKAAAKSVKKPAAKAAPKAAAKKAVAKTPAKKATSKSPLKKAVKAVKKAVKAIAKKAAAPAKPTKAMPPKQTSKPASSKTSKIDLSKMISPLDDRILVEVVESATRTPGGLFIPDSVDRSERHRQGTVVAVGRGHVGLKGKLRPLDVQLGDIVLFDHYMGSPLEVGGKDVLVLRESQLLGVVKP